VPEADESGHWAEVVSLQAAVTMRSEAGRHFKTYAPAVTIPVPFAMQWDDERFDRDGQLELCDKLGSHDKRLHAYPGRHSDDGPEALRVEVAFLQRYLE
jgi:hypothetical protein